MLADQPIIFAQVTEDCVYSTHPLDALQRQAEEDEKQDAEEEEGCAMVGYHSPRYFTNPNSLFGVRSLTRVCLMLLPSKTWILGFGMSASEDVVKSLNDRHGKNLVLLEL